MQAVDAPRVVQPPYAPEPDPVERFFRELCRAIEGRAYPSLQAKQKALEPILNACQAIRSGCGGCAVGSGSARPSRTCPPMLKWHNHRGLVLGSGLAVWLQAPGHGDGQTPVDHSDVQSLALGGGVNGPQLRTFPLGQHPSAGAA